MSNQPPKLHSSHWGAFSAQMIDGELTVSPFNNDPAPSALINNIPAALNHPARLSKPLVRKGWLEDGPGPDERRGSDEYIEMEWERALDLAAAEMKRLGATAALADDKPLPGTHVFGGSYGWSSAGRFHHAQGQVHRFLNSVFGGYVGSVDTYSSAAGAVILSLVWGNSLAMTRDQAYWQNIADHTEHLIAFGGIAVRNLAASPGGNSQHTARKALETASARGCKFVSVSPLADDFEDLPNVTRISPRPSTDVALMLGMACHLVQSHQVNHDYLERYTSGYERFEAYLTGTTDNIAKTPEWAEKICGVSAEKIRSLADNAAQQNTHITIAYSLQRAQNGEQPVWMALTLAAMLGHYPKLGGGFSYALASIGNIGKTPLAVPLPTLPQGKNGVNDFIPVARISELLLHPGKPYTYKGDTRHYADIQLVYWAGGNPFHHHQDLENLREAFSRPDTVIINESVSTASTRYADIIFPATITAEREDIGASGNDPFMHPMQQLTPPRGEARDDYDIFTALAVRLGCENTFTEGRSSREWQQHMYQRTHEALKSADLNPPDFDTFMDGEIMQLPLSNTSSRMQRFHNNPETHPLDTASGKIDICSEIVARSGLPEHPAWLEPEEWLGSPLAKKHQFQLIANQPKTRLHSQLDFGNNSMSGKQDGREIVRLNPKDADQLGIASGDIVRLWNDRGALLAAARLSEKVSRSVVQLSTGAWYAPRELPGSGLTCVNGNPNILTSDIGASGLSGGCAGQLSLVSVEKWLGETPDVVPHEAMIKVRRPEHT